MAHQKTEDTAEHYWAEARPIQSPDVQWRKVEGEVLIVDTILKQYHVLNSVAARIWQMADGERTCSQIARAVASEFSADPDRVFRDVLETLQGLERLRLLQFDDLPDLASDS